MFLRKTLYVTSKPVSTRLFLRAMSSESDDVLFQNVGDKGVITLNRPKALNALNLSMVTKLYPALEQWQNEKSLILIKGAGGKAFCAGGDVKSIALAGMQGEKLGPVFFKHEYKTDGLIGSLKIPYIAFIDGIVMGGGVGLSVHGPYRIATERSLFAMPETRIGLFPDVGGSHFLPRMQGKLGLFLALTGTRLKGGDLLRAGIATHYVDSKDLASIEAELLTVKSRQEIDKVLTKFAKTANEFSLGPVLDQINYCFGGGCLEEIVSRLETDGSEWAKDVLKLLGQMSPTSLKVTFRQLQLGEGLSLQECLQMEYRIAVNCLAKCDFYEGVRALLIDKDQNPKWNPANLADVTPDLVESHFTKLPEDQELRNKL